MNHQGHDPKLCSPQKKERKERKNPSKEAVRQCLPINFTNINVSAANIGIDNELYQYRQPYNGCCIKSTHTHKVKEGRKLWSM